MSASGPLLAPFEEELASPISGRPWPPSPTRRARRSPLRTCTNLCALLSVVVVGGVLWLVTSVAIQVVDNFAHPHRGHHADPTILRGVLGDPDQIRALEPDIVRSFYGRADVGSVDTFNLKAAIWLRTTEKLKDPDAPWELVYEDVVLRTIKIDSKGVHAVPRVRLSTEQLARLRTPHSRLQSTFLMLPSRERLDPSIDYHTWRTSRNASMHSIDGPVPPINIGDSDVPDKGVFRLFLANSACYAPLFKPSDRDEAAEDNSTSLYINTKSFVSLLDDFSIYNLSSYNQSLVERATWRHNECYYGAFGPAYCAREFSQDGHFESLIEYDDARDGDKTTATHMGWRYAPFITTRSSFPGPLDRVEIPALGSSEEKDFSFDWHISWAPLSPAKYHAARFVGSSLADTARQAETEHDRAVMQDMTDMLYSVVGHSVRADARPGLRAFVRVIQTVLLWIGLPLQTFYWYSRSLSTGISLPLASLESICSMSIALVTTYVDTVQGEQLGLKVLFLGLGYIELLYQIALLIRIHFTWGGPMSMVPLGFSRRRATHSERSSQRDDLRFSWSNRLLAMLVLALAYRLGPELPHLISANPPVQQPAHAGVETPERWTTVGPWLNAMASALHLVGNIGQIHLNYRRRTFGGNYRICAVFFFAFGVLELLPTLLVSVFGGWHLRSPIKISNVVELALVGILAVQAVRYRGVTQVEEEEE